ncbi:DUF2564 family protein [Priestia megaterium]|uniref:DUF2564 family protein n=1 Tax=Priestia megaterium TaxID=1404 RepID=UPI00221E67F9|nr:DUF2564 family protein [Priestia megaterium]UYV54424.1 DUF2564 family protein [Priestia megaterium]
MDKFSNEEVTTGYNDLKQVEVSIQSAQKMIGTATMSMSPQQLEEATNALNDAKVQLQSAKHGTGVDEQFLQQCMQSIQTCEQQLTEAKR